MNWYRIEQRQGDAWTPISGHCAELAAVNADEAVRWVREKRGDLAGGRIRAVLVRRLH